MRGCKGCGSSLEGYHALTQYCDKCKSKPGRCVDCNKPISRGAKRCPSCAGKASHVQKKEESRHCEICGDELKEHQERFCSLACLGASRVPVIPEGAEPPVGPDWHGWVYGGQPRPEVEFTMPVSEIVWLRAITGKGKPKNRCQTCGSKLPEGRLLFCSETCRPEGHCMDCGQEVPPGYITRCEKCAEEALWECEIGA